MWSLKMFYLNAVLVCLSSPWSFFSKNEDLIRKQFTIYKFWTQKRKSKFLRDNSKSWHSSDEEFPIPFVNYLNLNKIDNLMLPFSLNFDVGCDFFGYKRCFLDFKDFDIRFFTCPRTSQLEKVTCPEQQMYDSDNTDNWFRHPWCSPILEPKT